MPRRLLEFGAIIVAHGAVKGRTRFRLGGLYRSDALRRHLESALAATAGIREVAASATTGTVLVQYNSSNDIPSITAHMARAAEEFRRGLEDHAAVLLAPRAGSAGAGGGASEPAAREALRPWYLMDGDIVLATLDVAPETGLTREAARERLVACGLNALHKRPGRTALAVFAAQFKSLPVALLGVAAGLSAATGGIADALVILSVVGLNAVVGFFTERASDRIIKSLDRPLQTQASVIRDGRRFQVPIEHIVPGDILVVEPGSYLPADARVIEARELSVDESSLTGESLPVFKTASRLEAANTVLPERANMLYRGTTVTGGHGRAVVVATGRFTEIGKIHALLHEVRPPLTPMQKQLGQLGDRLVLAAVAACGVFFFIGFLRGRRIFGLVKSSVSLAVAAVPEGLPAVATTTLAIGILNMRRRGVLIRRLEAVETLGCIEVLCLDKTGTVTLNHMSAVELRTASGAYTLRNGAFHDENGLFYPFDSDEVIRLLQVAVLCNQSQVDRAGRDFRLSGSPTENALLEMALAVGIDVDELRAAYPAALVRHRSETAKHMSTTHRVDGGKSLIALKGAPDEVLAKCRFVMREGRIEPLDAPGRESLGGLNEAMAAAGQRVLALAYRGAWDEDDPEVSGYVWLGLVGLADPVRPRMASVIGEFRRAGIETVMLTGDQKATAAAVAQELGLGDGGELVIVHAEHLSADGGAERPLPRRAHVFARVSPSNKFRVVRALQSAGKVVAMTGDGINDGPALRAADVGIGMGGGGTEVAREVADIVLEKDDLETLIVAVRQGRATYDNIRKSIRYLLSTNASEILVMLAAAASGMPEPLNALQLLWINLISDVFPSLALATDPPEPDIASRRPRRPDAPILSGAELRRNVLEGGTQAASAFGAYLYALARYGAGGRAGTIAFGTLTTAQLLHALSSRSQQRVFFRRPALPPNRKLAAAIGASLALQGLALVAPWLRRLLRTTPVSLADAVVMAGGAILPLAVNEWSKPAPARSASPVAPRIAARGAAPAPPPPDRAQPAPPAGRPRGRWSRTGT
jgi:Ca2+-transporting ATPase